MSGTGKTGEVSEKKKNKTPIIIIIILVVAVAALVAVVVYLLGRGDRASDGREVAGSVRTVVDGNGADDIMNQMREEVAEGMFECNMSMTWTFNDGSSESGDAYVANSVNNTHPICFDVYLKDSEELLYKSPVLPVGTDLKDIKLDRALSAGEYKATVMYTLLKDVENQEEISTAGFVITLKILN